MPDTAPEYEYKNPFNEEAEGIEIKHLGDLAGEMVYRLPGCSALMIRKELQQSWYEFASRTGILRFPMKMALVEGKRKYGLTAPCPAAISRVSGFMLAMEDADGVHPHRYEWAWHRIGYANNGEHATVLLDFNIDADFLKTDNRLLCKLECRPLVATEDIPAPMYARWGHAIVAGAMAHLCALNTNKYNYQVAGNRPWADPALAQQSQIEFENAINEASLDTMRDPRGNINAVNWEGWA